MINIVDKLIPYIETNYVDGCRIEPFSKVARNACKAGVVTYMTLRGLYNGHLLKNDLLNQLHGMVCDMRNDVAEGVDEATIR